MTDAVRLMTDQRTIGNRVMRALAPHWGALLALALFMVAGLAIFDEYGALGDAINQREIASRNLAYIQGMDDEFTSAIFWVRLYGIAFEAPLLLMERAFSIDDARGFYLFRHLLTHLFFLTGGVFAYLLAYRLLGSKLLALFAMPLLLLHPRLYGHSFFNTKDIPFLVMFIIALYLMHRAFKRGGVSTFILLGIGVGILINLRTMGVILIAAVLALRALDFVFERGGVERKRVLITAGAFVLTSGAMFFVLMPYLWADPMGRAVEWWVTLSNHPDLNRALPRAHLPIQISITSPPFALLLGLAGVAAIFVRSASAPFNAARNTRLRFGLSLLACFAIPILVAIVTGAISGSGRHMYFAWAPFALLGALGLGWLASAIRMTGFRTAVYGATLAGLSATLISMALIHPYQRSFFNFSVDRVTPERLRTQHGTTDPRLPMPELLEWLSDNADLLPDKPAHSGRIANKLTLENIEFLPDAMRERIEELPGFALVYNAQWESWSRSRSLHRAQIYNNTIMTIELKDDLEAVYEMTRPMKPVFDAAFAAYRLDEAVALVMEPCAPAFLREFALTLYATPVDSADLPLWREGQTSEPRNFRLAEYGAFFDGKCVASIPLPDYPVHRIGLDWHSELLDHNVAMESMLQAKSEGSPLARSFYDIYIADDQLVYIREECDPLGTEHRFRLKAHPRRVEDLPEKRHGARYEEFRFNFYKHGALLDGPCVALFPLPDYPIAGIRTGQYVEGDEGREDLWDAAFSTNPEPYRTAYRVARSGEPVAEDVFDIHLLDGDLVFVKEPCEQGDTENRFFLHIAPERVSDLQESRRELGWDNLDFAFFLNGARFDRKCAARITLPSYPIASIRTGQFISGVGEVWSVDIRVKRVSERTRPTSQ